MLPSFLPIYSTQQRILLSTLLFIVLFNLITFSSATPIPRGTSVGASIAGIGSVARVGGAGDSKSGLNDPVTKKRVIIGCSVGGGFIVFTIGVVFFYKREKRKRDREREGKVKMKKKPWWRKATKEEKREERERMERKEEAEYRRKAREGARKRAEEKWARGLRQGQESEGDRAVGKGEEVKETEK